MLVSETSEEMKVEKWHVFKISSNDCKSFCKQRNHNATLTQFLFTFRLSNSHFYIPILAYISICWYHIVCYLHIYISLYFHMLSIEIQSFTFFWMRLTSRSLRFDVGRVWRHLHWWHLWISLWRWNIRWFRWMVGILIWLWKWWNCNIKHIIIGYNRDIDIDRWFNIVRFAVFGRMIHACLLGRSLNHQSVQKSIAQIYPKNMVLNNNLSWRGLSLGWFMGNSTGTYGFPHIFCLLTAILRVFSLRRVCKFWVMVFTICYNAI